MGCYCIPFETVEQERSKWQGQIDEESKWPRVKMDYFYLSPERVELTVSSKKETNGRVKRGKGSRWAAIVYPLKQSNKNEANGRVK